MIANQICLLWTLVMWFGDPFGGHRARSEGLQGFRHEFVTRTIHGLAVCLPFYVPYRGFRYGMWKSLGFGMPIVFLFWGSMVKFFILPYFLGWGFHMQQEKQMLYHVPKLLPAWKASHLVPDIEWTLFYPIHTWQWWVNMKVCVGSIYPAHTVLGGALLVWSWVLAPRGVFKATWRRQFTDFFPIALCFYHSDRFRHGGIRQTAGAGRV